eukprot:958226-Pelagomonas_calceolata.AAC.1
MKHCLSDALESHSHLMMKHCLSDALHKAVTDVSTPCPNARLPKPRNHTRVFCYSPCTSAFSSEWRVWDTAR